MGRQLIVAHGMQGQQGPKAVVIRPEQRNGRRALIRRPCAVLEFAEQCLVRFKIQVRARLASGTPEKRVEQCRGEVPGKSEDGLRPL
jgi:hypothetical protein